MSELQHDLFDPPSGAEPPERHRLFFAVMPDDQARDAMCRAAGIVEQHHADIRPRWIRAELYHATLNFLGEYTAYPEDVVRKAKLAGEKLQATTFGWTLDYVSSFRGREPPCVLRGSVVPKPLMTLWQSLNKELVFAGLKHQVEHRFEPHVTLAYGHSELTGSVPILPFTWHVQGVVLVHNEVGKGGYRLLGHWPLSPQTP